MVVADEPGDHAVVDAPRVPLDDLLQLPAPVLGHRQLLEMGLDEVPSGLGAGATFGEALLQTAVGLVDRDDQVLLDGRGRGDLAVAALFLVQRRDLGDHEAGLLQRYLDGVPDARPAVGEDHGHPATGLQDPMILREAALHQVLVLGQRLVLEAVDDGLGLGVGGHAVPGLDQKIEVGVVDVFAERWVGEDVVNAVVG